MTDTDWQRRAAQLTNELVAEGDLPDPAWQRVFPTVPRHLFVPGHPPDEAYGPRAIVTQTRSAQVAGGTTMEMPTSSLSAPGAVAVMLDRLNLTDGQRVLEIGTGTGYNTALLCARLGDANVTSVDIDPDLVLSAGARLAELGYRPRLVAGDGHAGVSDGAPYDAILATCAIGQLPPAWIGQLARGGRLVAPLASAQDGPLAVLHKSADDEVTGTFDPQRMFFMPLRPQVNNPLANPHLGKATGLAAPHYGTTTVDPNLLVKPDADLALFCHLHIGGMDLSTTDWNDGRTTVTVTDDTSTAEATRQPVSPGAWTVVQRGPRRLWDSVEHAVRLWRHLGQPRRDRLGITAPDHADRQHVWLDNPNGPYSWPMLQ